MVAIDHAPPPAIEYQIAAAEEHAPTAKIPYPAVRQSGPEPVKGLAHDITSRYKIDDPTHSVIDPERSAKYDAAITPLRASRSAFAKQANRYLFTHQKADALLVGNWLENWAKHDAMTQFFNNGDSKIDKKNDDTQQFNLSLSLPSIAMSYAQVKQALPPEQQATIDAWLKKVDDTLDDPRDDKHAKENHAYWKAAAHASVGVVTGDAARFENGYRMALVGVKECAPDLLYPAEMKRGERSTDYQFYATVPLILVAELSFSQGKNLYEEEGGTLRKMIDQRLLSILQDDKETLALIEKKAKVKQVPIKQTDLPAMAAYNRRFPNPAMTKAINAYLKRTALGAVADSEEQTLDDPKKKLPTIDDLFFPELGGKIDLLYPLGSSADALFPVR